MPLAACSGITIEKPPLLQERNFWRTARGAICGICIRFITYFFDASIRFMTDFLPPPPVTTLGVTA
jgi:hypothetical protein